MFSNTIYQEEIPKEKSDMCENLFQLLQQDLAAAVSRTRPPTHFTVSPLPLFTDTPSSMQIVVQFPVMAHFGVTSALLYSLLSSALFGSTSVSRQTTALYSALQRKSDRSYCGLLSLSGSGGTFWRAMHYSCSRPELFLEVTSLVTVGTCRMWKEFGERKTCQ